MVGTLADAAGAALRARTDTLQRAAFVYHNGFDYDVAGLEFLGLLRILSFPVGDGALEEFLKILGCIPLGIVKKVQGVVYFLTADSVSDKAHLLRGGRYVVKFSDSGLLLGLFQALGHQSFSLSHNVNPLNITSYCCLRGRGKCGWERTRPACDLPYSQ